MNVLKYIGCGWFEQSLNRKINGNETMQKFFLEKYDYMHEKTSEYVLERFLISHSVKSWK